MLIVCTVVMTINIQNKTTVQTDDQDTKHNNSTNTIRMQHLTTVLTDDQHLGVVS
jgi:hypothetical protein